MRKVTLERRRQRRRDRLARLAILVGLLLVAWGGAGTVLGVMPLHWWGVIAAGTLVDVWLVYEVRSRTRTPESGHAPGYGASTLSMTTAVIRLGLSLGILVNLALTILGWAVALKS